METKVYDRLCEILKSMNFKNDLSPYVLFVDDLGADSLDLVEIVMAVEEEFNIEIPDEDAEKIKTISDAVLYIKLHSKQAL